MQVNTVPNAEADACENEFGLYNDTKLANKKDVMLENNPLNLVSEGSDKEIISDQVNELVTTQREDSIPPAVVQNIFQHLQAITVEVPNPSTITVVPSFTVDDAVIEVPKLVHEQSSNSNTMGKKMLVSETDALSNLNETNIMKNDADFQAMATPSITKARDSWADILDFEEQWPPLQSSKPLTDDYHTASDDSQLKIIASRAEDMEKKEVPWITE